MSECKKIRLDSTHWYKIGQLKHKYDKDSIEELIELAIDHLWKEAKLM